MTGLENRRRVVGLRAFVNLRDGWRVREVGNPDVWVPDLTESATQSPPRTDSTCRYQITPWKS